MKRRWVLLLCLLAPPAVLAGAADDRALIGQLDREIIALKQRIRHLEDRAASCGAAGEPAPVYAELVQAFAGQPVTVTREGGQTQVSLPADLLFSSGVMSLREEGQFALDLLSTGLKAHPETHLRIVGHADGESLPSSLRKLYPGPWEISWARANVVARELIEGYGVSPHRFTVAGRGDQEPVATGDTAEGRAQNRRIVVHILPGAPK